ncbi:MAG: probable short chain oxidoreductase [uncultured Rubrobacteraceae bacterium]|uniref:Probable short chain oxidoreductase n=1 Tax=uncultured Rubrobacteraceae bacterium TaxID=349277 RepID=A0A6J4U0S5_9ACTN|nr:MAG: probable short chain oxidoreductase [uncultured Rubrobacteraceae bacterium]
MNRTALVTGGNRGIGFEACRQLAKAGLRVVLTARDAVRGEEAAETLRDEGLDVRFEQLDVTDGGSVEACARRLSEAGTEIDVLVNNAGVYPTGDVFQVDEETFRRALEINTLGPFRTCRTFVPAMVRRGYGRAVNVSSGGGSFGEGIGPAAYGASKAALNALTVKVAEAVRGDVKVNAMCPGWVRTDMGGAGASRSPEQAAGTLLWLATLPADGPNGGFFRDRKPIPW